jgi:ATP-dependent helicase/nuclease subunit A
MATEIQRRAARPDVSVALRASAGSGKTKVLVDRFIRLCVEDTPARTHPRSILAVTFTREAAVEIQKRLLAKASGMVLAEPSELRRRLRDLFGDRPEPEPNDREMQRAADLYEMVLEDLAGLHVGTIHSFCQLILGRFAAEAGLDPHFTVIENQDELVDEALDQLEEEMSKVETLAAAGRTVGPNPSSVRVAVKEIFYEQMRVERWLNRHDEESGLPGGRTRLDKLPGLLKDLRAFLFPDLDSDQEPDPEAFVPLLAKVLEEFTHDGLDNVDAGMGADADRTTKNSAKLRASCLEALDLPPADQLVAVRKIFLTNADKTRAFTLVRDEEIKARYNALVVESALPVLRILHTAGYLKLYALNRDLLHLGLRALDIYSALKRRDRVVDFQDLEDMACRLMGDQARALSLLYRLDDSIHHILLDEFQDTNFNQWDMLEPFVGEFLSGDAEDHKRTLFFVGDMKQSIYGFRGAEPVIFSYARKLLKARNQPVLNLPTNFRSLGAVVEGIGCLFNASPLGDSFTQEEREAVRQEWSRRDGPGVARVLDPYLGGDPEDDPVDGRSGDQLAADAAARLVLHLKESGAVTWEKFDNDLVERPLRWADFLVLTRSRTEISLYEKAFRVAGIPIVPPGRGMLTASREVQDILALLRWLVWPEDDVALAAVLRSPIFRIGQKDFQAVLARRGLFRTNEEGKTIPPRGLWQAIGKDEDDPVTGRAVALLKNWRKHLGFESGHDLLRRIYREGLVLEKYQLALGDQARYNLMRLFDMALSPETSGTPTVRRLADFIARAASQGGQEEGTLPHGGAEGRVRFMTIHGAKGLEAPVVLLVDADRSTGKESPRVRTDAGASDTPLLFKVNKNFRKGFTLPDEVPWTRDALQIAAQVAADRDSTEEANLLYVAMTRARDRLYVLGGDKWRGDDHDSPLRRIQQSAAGGTCAGIEMKDPDFLDRPPAPVEEAASAHSVENARIEMYRTWRPPVLRERMRIITPSAAEGELPSLPMQKRPPGGPSAGDDERSGRETGLSPTERGNKVHQLLQLAADLGSLPPGTGETHTEAAAVFENPDLSWIFRPENGRGLSEVPVIHRRTAASADKVEERIIGSIDRLVLPSGRADIIDYKTNRLGGDPAHRKALLEHYRPQLAAYREVVQSLYPDREVRTWLLFTDPGSSATGDSPLTQVF